MLGQPLAAPAAPTPLRFRVLCLRGLLRGVFNEVFGRVVGEQTERVGLDALPPRAVLAAEQLLDLMLQLLDPSSGLLDRVRLLADDLVAEGQIVGQIRRLHAQFWPMA